MGFCDDEAVGSLSGNGAEKHGGETEGSTWDKIVGSTLNSYAAPYFDTLGNDASGRMTGITGGPEQRAAIFSRMNSVRPLIYNASDQAANRAMTAARNPGFTAAANQANRVISGDYLHGSPELNALLAQTRAGGARQMADANANIRSGFARNGMNFSTANQQAQQSNNALATARANDTEAQTRFANYAAERQNQNEGVNQLNSALSSPLNYLSQVSASQLAPLSQMANLVTGLTNGQQRNVDRIERDGMLRGLFKTVGAL